MSRRSIIKDSEEEIIKEAEVVMRWSKKRIVIATVVVFFVIVGGIYVISLLSSRTGSVLGEKTASSDSPAIKIPDKEVVQETLDNAKKDLSDINAKNIIASQPQLKKIIDDLTNLTGSSSSAKNLICDSLCK